MDSTPSSLHINRQPIKFTPINSQHSTAPSRAPQANKLTMPGQRVSAESCSIPDKPSIAKTSTQQKRLSIAKRPLCRIKQTNDCRILQKWPLDLVHLVVDKLGPVSRNLLAQTCSQFRVFMRQHHLDYATDPRRYVSFSRRHSTNSLLQYLTILSRDMPTKWACQKCARLHEADVEDGPGGRFHGHCPQESEVRPGLTFWPAAHHIQLALKYTRAQNSGSVTEEQLTHRRHIMGRHDEYPTRPWLFHDRVVWSKQFVTEYKVVDGRFMMKVTRFYQLEEGETMDSYKEWEDKLVTEVCQHQHCRSEKNINDWEVYQSLSGNQVEPDLWRRHVQLLQTVADAIGNPGKANGSCPCCATDFEVLIFQDDAFIVSYHDLGTEEAASDPTRIHKGLFSENRDYRYVMSRDATKTAYHELGNLTRAWKTKCDDAEMANPLPKRKRTQDKTKPQNQATKKQRTLRSNAEVSRTTRKQKQTRDEAKPQGKTPRSNDDEDGDL